jgi:hypothetical protein
VIGTHLPGPKGIYITDLTNQLTHSLAADSYVGVEQISQIENSMIDMYKYRMDV